MEEDEVVETIEKLVEKYPRLSDAWELGWKWRLARGPEIDAFCIDGINPRAYLIQTDEVYAGFGVPPLTVLYRFDDDQVVIIAVKLAR